MKLPQILCIIPIALLRWILSGIGFIVSGYFLVANIYPVLVSVRHLCLIAMTQPHLMQADQKPVRLLIVVIAVLHTAVALLFKVLFFSYYIEPNIGPADPTL
jgi:protein YIPF1/2